MSSTKQQIDVEGFSTKTAHSSYPIHAFLIACFGKTSPAFPCRQGTQDLLGTVWIVMSTEGADMAWPFSPGAVFDAG